MAPFQQIESPVESSASVDRLTGSETHDSSKHNLSHMPTSNVSSPSDVREHFLPQGRPVKRQKTSQSQRQSKIEANVSKFGTGIFKTPYPRAVPSLQDTFPGASPNLPPKEAADILLSHYHSTIHPTLPVVYWRSFTEQYESVYSDGHLRKASSVWCSLLFAILACGSLHRSWSDGRQYLDISKSFIDPWSDNLTLDHARTALLHSLFLVESNNQSAGWVWMGFAIRISFELGLNCEAGSWTPLEEEMRRRAWWSIYAADW